MSTCQWWGNHWKIADGDVGDVGDIDPFSTCSHPYTPFLFCYLVTPSLNDSHSNLQQSPKDLLLWPNLSISFTVKQHLICIEHGKWVKMSSCSVAGWSVGCICVCVWGERGWVCLRNICTPNIWEKIPKVSSQSDHSISSTLEALPSNITLLSQNSCSFTYNSAV